ncbi:MAG: hypothetical protein Q8942_04985, partial [Bacillota bacterium]|nr:hypothetical protein [Bacillota bacterium]
CEKDYTLKMQLIRLHFTIKAELFATYESRYIFCNIKNVCKMFIAKYIGYCMKKTLIERLL